MIIYKENFFFLTFFLFCYDIIYFVLKDSLLIFDVWISSEEHNLNVYVLKIKVTVNNQCS